MENRTFDIPSFVTRTIFEFFWITPPPKYRMKLRIRFGNCSKLASKIVLRTTWLRIRKVREWFEVRETLASNIFFHSCSRAIFFITLFVMNYKVASLEIIRGSRDPVFFFIFLIRLISSKRTKWLFEWKDRNYFVSLVNSFSYLNLIFDKKFLNVFHVFKIYCSDNCSWIYVFSFLTIEVNIVEVNILWNSLGWLLFFFFFFFFWIECLFFFSLFLSLFSFFFQEDM